MASMQLGTQPCWLQSSADELVLEYVDEKGRITSLAAAGALVILGAVVMLSGSVSGVVLGSAMIALTLAFGAGSLRANRMHIHNEMLHVQGTIRSISVPLDQISEVRMTSHYRGLRRGTGILVVTADGRVVDTVARSGVLAMSSDTRERYRLDQFARRLASESNSRYVDR